MTLDFVSILAQASSFVVWPLIENKSSLWLIPISVLLISIGWWENFVSENSPNNFIKNIGINKKTFNNHRYFSYLFISLWKCVIFFVTALIIIFIKEDSVEFMFDLFVKGFEEHKIHITEVEPIVPGSSIQEIIKIGPGIDIISSNLTPVWVFLINISCTYGCYAFAKFACKILVQRFSFAFPLNLAVPVTISGLIAMSGYYADDSCYYSSTIPRYLFFKIPPIYSLGDFLGEQLAWIWLLWLLSQAWITVHIWNPRCEKLARTERLFVKPMFDPYLIDQDIALNRRQEDRPEKRDEDVMEEDDVSMSKFLLINIYFTKFCCYGDIHISNKIYFYLISFLLFI